MTKTILVLGGASDIGQAIARRFAAEGFGVQLAARSPERLEPVRSDIAIRHNVEVTTHAYDALDVAGAEAFLDALPVKPTVVCSVVGWMGDQDATAGDADMARRAVESNFLGPAWVLEAAAKRLAEAGGSVIGVSSVAGDRGRAKNYWYGAAKAGFTAFLSGLRQKYAATPLHVLTVKPGFVDTAMTKGMDLPGPLTASAEELGEGVFRAWKKGRTVVYLRPIWWVVMTIICFLPEWIFMKTKF